MDYNRLHMYDIFIIGAADKVYSKVHRKSYDTCGIIIIGEKVESKCYRMRVPTCGSIIMTELYSKVHRITVRLYDMIIMQKIQNR